jgi:hypothetical protein
MFYTKASYNRLFDRVKAGVRVSRLKKCIFFNDDDAHMPLACIIIIIIVIHH